MIVLFAPHVDDELIGCFSWLVNGVIDKVVYTENVNPQRRIEAKSLANKLDYDIDFIIDHSHSPLWIDASIVLAPDPHWEFHPAHRKLGMEVRSIAQETGKRFVSYSTNMNVPYLREISQPDYKRDLMNQYFPSQSDLWKYDHRYWLFEGMSEWAPRGV